MFLRRADADAALASVLRDEPESRDLLSVVEIELDQRDVSPNWRRGPRHTIASTAVASYSALPEPMLARSGRLTASGDAYEVKWDGFRAIVSTEGSLRVRSRRGWDMTPFVGFLAQLPARAIFDGELVALDDEGRPDFPLICECLLQHRFTIPLTS